MNEQDIARFWSKVERRGPDECWPWNRGTQNAGYGMFYCIRLPSGRRALAHRVAFFLANGRWPEPCGLHRCDNRPCCNPGHVFEGTKADNTADMFAKGRGKFPVLSGKQHWRHRRKGQG